MKFLETKIVPPLVMAVFAALMWGVAQVTSPFSLPGELSSIIAKIFLFGGLAILFVAALYFFKAKTTLNPMNPKNSSALITTGLYAFSRNPIYVADILFLLSWGFFLSNIFSLLLVLGFAPYLSRFQIKPEEEALEQLFGNDYIAYKSKVRRWI
ncbi:MAG: isoprenylcysteine carboxylmethyltransferase family protein [Devosiaceae bacterium]|nr:isoprenylcysteine carboxylmethyltransferase family protein [Devosiaceae bacterium]